MICLIMVVLEDTANLLENSTVVQRYHPNACSVRSSRMSGGGDGLVTLPWFFSEVVLVPRNTSHQTGQNSSVIILSIATAK